MSQHIAIVEDEPAIRDNYADAFRRAGYRVSTFAGRRAALDAFGARMPDLVVIDVSLGAEPEGGFELCRELRTRAPRLPLIFLTARDSDFDAVSGLRLGADDYLTKDISLPHLLARIAALFRRVQALTEPASTGRALERGKLRLDAERLEARWDERDPGLTLTEFWIVHALAQHPGHVKNRQQLMDAARVVLDDATITSHVKRIRRKFEQLDPGFDAIQTVYGLGYRWRDGAAA